MESATMTLSFFERILAFITCILQFSAILGEIILMVWLIYFLTGIIKEAIQKCKKPQVDRKYNIVRYKSKSEKNASLLISIIIGCTILIGIMLLFIFLFIIFFFKVV